MASVRRRAAFSDDEDHYDEDRYKRRRTGATPTASDDEDYQPSGTVLTSGTIPASPPVPGPSTSRRDFRPTIRDGSEFDTDEETEHTAEAPSAAPVPTSGPVRVPDLPSTAQPISDDDSEEEEGTDDESDEGRDVSSGSDQVSDVDTASDFDSEYSDASSEADDSDTGHAHGQFLGGDRGKLADRAGVSNEANIPGSATPYNSIDVKRVSGTIDIGNVVLHTPEVTRPSDGHRKDRHGRSGWVTAETVSGDVRVGRHTGALGCTVKTISGDVRVHGCDGQHLHITTTSGDIRGGCVMVPMVGVSATHDNGSHVAGMVKTTSGDISLSFTVEQDQTRASMPRTLMVENGSGSVNLKMVGFIGEYDISSQSGSVSVHGDGMVGSGEEADGKVQRGDVRPDEFNGPIDLLQVKASSGNIKVTFAR